MDQPAVALRMIPGHGDGFAIPSSRASISRPRRPCRARQTRQSPRRPSPPAPWPDAPSRRRVGARAPPAPPAADGPREGSAHRQGRRVAASVLRPRCTTERAAQERRCRRPSSPRAGPAPGRRVHDASVGGVPPDRRRTAREEGAVRVRDGQPTQPVRQLLHPDAARAKARAARTSARRP